MTVPRIVEEIDRLRSEAAHWRGLAQRWRRELDTLYERVDDPPSPPLDLVPLTVAHRCECCGRMMPVGTLAAHFYDDDHGDVYAHAGPCVADDRHITIALETGDENVPARVIGMWAMHRKWRQAGFNVTHVPSGRSAVTGVERDVAWALVKRLGLNCSGDEYALVFREVPRNGWGAVKRIIAASLEEAAHV